MPNDTNPEHRAQAWATLGAALVGIGGVGAGTLATVGTGSHLWGDGVFLAGFVFACLLIALGVYVLVGEFIGGDEQASWDARVEMSPIQNTLTAAVNSRRRAARRLASPHEIVQARRSLLFG